MVKRLLVVAAVLVFAVPASAARLPILASHDWWPVFSPDGRHVAFTNVDGQGRVFTLEVVDVSKASRPVTTLARSSAQLLPSWSPDSTQLAYQLGGHIWTVRVDGTGRRQVAAGLYPAWSPGGSTIAFVAGGVVHAGAAALGSGVLGPPAWSPDGERLAFAQTDGVYVAAAADGTTHRVATPASEVRTVYWSPVNDVLAYASGKYVYTVPADGSAAPTRIAGPFAGVGPLAWTSTADAVAYTAQGALRLTYPGRATQSLARTDGIGASFAPSDPHSDILAFSGGNPRCPGHDAIRMFQNGAVTGSCAIAGTAGPDVIDGTSAGGDVISAGAGNDRVHARNGRRDTVLCGPGRDTVWADRRDTLAGCEIVHR